MISFVQSLPPFKSFVLCKPKRGFEEHVRALGVFDILISQSDKSNENVIFSGMAIIGREYLDSEEEFTAQLQRSKLSLTDLLQLSGAFTCVLRRENNFYVFGDKFGYSPIFVFADEKMTLISNRLHALALTMAAMKIVRSPDYSIASNFIGSDATWFRQTFSNRTVISGVEVLPLDEYIEICGNQVVRRKKVQVLNAFDESSLSRSQYVEMVEEGIQAISDNVDALSQTSKFTNRRFQLTGGRDSRLIYGFLLSRGYLSRYQIQSFPPTSDANRKDLEVSTELTSLFGGSYWSEDLRQRFHIASEHALNFAISYQAGLVRSIGVNNWPSLGSARTTLGISGGGGELFRTQNWRIFELAKIWDKQSPHCFVEAIYNFLVPPDAINPKFRADAFEVFERSILELPGDDIRKKVENHYAYHRNRGHFGVRDTVQFLDWSMYTPLDSLELVRASRSLPFDQFAQEACEFDILDRVAPALNFVPYAERGSWPDVILSRSSLFSTREVLKVAVEQCDAGAKVAEWEAGQTSISKHREKEFGRSPSINTWGDLERLIEQRALTALEEMFDVDLILREMFLGGGQQVADEIRSRSPHWFRLCAKILEIHTLVFNNIMEGIVFSPVGKVEKKPALSLFTKAVFYS